jgi:hypothetical protein
VRYLAEFLFVSCQYGHCFRASLFAAVISK